MNIILKIIFPSPVKGEKVNYKKQKVKTTTPDNIPLRKWMKGEWSNYINDIKNRT